MNLVRRTGVNPALFNLIPFLNVAFLLVVFFTLGSTFILQPGLPLNLPLSAVTLAPVRNPRIVSITASPVPEIYFKDKRVALGDLANALAADRSEDRSLIIRADREVPYNVVMQAANLGLQAGYAVVLAAEGRK